MSTPEYCSECSWLTDKMGACLPPGKAAILSYISYIPYLIIIAFIILTLFSRH